MGKSKIHVDEVRKALKEIGYDKPEVFIHHLRLEEGDDSEFSVRIIKHIAFGMLKFNYEEVFLSKLGIA